MKENINNSIKNIIQNQDDLTFNETVYNNINISYCYIPEVTDLKYFNNFYLSKINNDNYLELDTYIPGIFIKITDVSIDNISYIIGKGNLIITINNEVSYQVVTTSLPKRNVQPSEIDPTNLLDGKDGLVENVYTNLALIRKRIKYKDLVIKKFILGSITQTETFVLYIKDIEDKHYVKNILSKISSYNKESIININDINSIFNSSILLPSAFNTGSPDYISGALLEGRVCIISDNTPVAAILPSTLSLYTSIKNASNAPKYYTISSRIFNILFFYMSLFLLSIFVALINFNPNFFSTLFIANVQLNERGTTFPLFIESLLILLMFEFYRFTTSRSPNNYVQNIVIIFGGLFIGQNAIKSGIIGSTILLLTALAYTSSFALTNNPYLITTFNIFRIYNLVLSYTLGVLGFSIGLITTLLYFNSQKSVGVPFMDPFIPINKKGILNYFMPSHGVKNEKD